MNAAALALVAEFESAAKVTQAAEAELRKTMAQQIAQLERQRAFAFRRTRLIRVLAADTGSEAPTPEEIWQGQRRAVREELGWTGASEAHDAILARLEPVGRAVWQRVHGTEDETAKEPEVAAALEAFEAWFEASHGKSFYALFDQYFQEVPVVDF